MRSRFKAWANPLLNLHPEVIKTAVDTSDSFYQDGVSLEIGGGKGAFSLDKASHGEKMLVLEKDSSVSGLFLKKYLSYEEPLPIHWVREDFDKFYSELRKLRFNRIYLNFSDPWPKKRHEKRRLTFPTRLKMFNSLLTSDGKVYFKTDNDSLFAYTLEALKETNISPLLVDDDYQKEDDDSETEYEKNFRSKGVKIKRIIWGKNDAIPDVL